LNNLDNLILQLPPVYVILFIITQTDLLKELTRFTLVNIKIFKLEKTLLLRLANIELGNGDEAVIFEQQKKRKSHAI